MRLKKRQLQVTAEAFNGPSFSAKNAAKVLQLLLQHGQTGDSSAASNVSEDRAADVRSIVRFLRDSPGLNKEKIGLVLGEPDALSQAVLAAYTDTFVFEDRPFTECLRIFLESFRLPGESQKIDRIVESFAARYQSQNQPLAGAALTAGADDACASDGPPTPGLRHSTRGVFANADAVFTLSFAVVMLNTDQHNPSIRKKMTVDDFVKNTRGINDKKDLPRWFLAEVFESISAVEIRMSEEAGMRALTDLHWDEQLRDMTVNGRVMSDVGELSVFDEDVFMVCWASCVSAATVVFNEASDAGAVQRALEGLLNVARCGAAFRRSEPTDAVVSVLTVATSLREGPLYGTAVRFGTDIKAQMASVALSGVSRQCGDWMRTSGWTSLVAYILRLHALGLLPDAMEDALGGYGDDLTCADGAPLPDSTLTPTWWPSQQVKMAAQERAVSEGAVAKTPPKQQKMNGFFALIAASIGGDSLSDDEYDSEDEVYHDVPPAYLKLRSAEDAEAEELARKCVAACRIDDVLINEAKVLRSEALSCLAEALAQAASSVLDGDSPDSGRAASGGGASSSNNAHGSDAAAGSAAGASFAGGMGAGATGVIADKSLISARGDSSIIGGTARIVRNSGSSVESDVELNGFGGTPQWSGVIRERDERKARASVAAFCINALRELTLQNRDRLSIPWPALHGILLRVIDRETRSVALLECAVVALLRVANRLLHREEIHCDVLRGLNLIVNLPAKTAEELSVPVAAGVYNMVKTYGSHISSVSGWHALLSIIESGARFSTVSRDISFQSLSFLLTDDPSFEAVSGETYAPLLEAVLAYTACPSVDVSMQALELLCALSQRIPKLAQSVAASSGTSPGAVAATDRPWAEYWGPLLRGFATAARDPRGKVRNTSLSVLERVIATGGPASHLTARQWQMALTSILLPLMDELFTSNGLLRVTVDAERAAQTKLIADRNAVAAASAPRGRGSRTAVVTPEHNAQLMKTVKAACDRTRLRAVMLMSKTFLQHHACMAEGLAEVEFTDIWLGVLKAFKLALEGGKAERGATKGSVDSELREHVPESIKNILLVLCASGLLDKDGAGTRWEDTFTRLHECLPLLELENFILLATSPPSPAPPSRPATPVESASAAGGEEEGRDESFAAQTPSEDPAAAPAPVADVEDDSRANGRPADPPAPTIVLLAASETA